MPFVRPVTTQVEADTATVHVAPPGEATTRYEVTGPPPEPAPTVTVAAPFPASTAMTDGVVGAGLPGVTGDDVAAAPQPAPDSADTATVYVMPLVSPGITQDVAGAGTKHDAPPGEATARYCVTAKDPGLVGATHDTVVDPLPATTLTAAGADGGTGVGGVGGVGEVGVTAFDTADEPEVPAELDAVEVKV